MEKLIPKRLLLVTLLTVISVYASAYDFKVDGIYYNVLSETNKTCVVTYDDFSKKKQLQWRRDDSC